MAEQPLINNPEDIRLNELGEIQQILGHPPGWMLRWGILMIFITIIVLGCLSWMIQYPDVIEARAVITTENPPRRIKAQNAGKLSELIVQDTQLVKQGQILAVLENAAQRAQVLQLDSLLKPISSQPEPLTLLNLELPKNVELGPIQKVYSDLNMSLDKYQFYLSQQSAYKQILALNRQKSQLEALEIPFEKQIQTLEQELSLAEKNLNRERQLRNADSNAEINVEKAEAVKLQVERNLENSRSVRIQNQFAIEELNTQILEIREGDLDQKNQTYIQVKEQLNLVKSEIEAWKQAFLIIAPSSGKVEIAEGFVENQFVDFGQEIMSIVPNEGIGAIIGKAKLSGAGLGKVRDSMDVQLRLDAFPYKEFGIVEGTVASIALTPEILPNAPAAYELIVDFPNGLKTTYKDKPNLPFRQEMEGDIRIITDKRTFLSRIFDRIYDLLYNRTK